MSLTTDEGLLSPQSHFSGGVADLSAEVTEAWRVGFQPLGPLRSQTFWRHLTRLDHPERLRVLRKLESNLPRIGEGQVSQIEISMGELFEPAGNFLRLLLLAVRPRAKSRRAMQRLLAIQFGRKTKGSVDGYAKCQVQREICEG
jgi:hypothetical protein